MNSNHSRAPWALAILLAFSLGACSQSQRAGTAPSADSGEDESPTESNSTSEDAPDSGGTPESSATADPPAASTSADQVILKAAADVSADDLATALAGLGLGEVSLRESIGGWQVATFPATSPARDEAASRALADQVGALPQVESAQPNTKSTKD